MGQRFRVLVVACSLLSGCAQLPHSQSNMNNLLLAEPQSSSYKDELMLARLNEIIAKAGRLEDEQRAVLYFKRGVSHDNLGLSTLARLDFQQVLALKPDHSEAHNFMGIYLTQAQQFANAFEEFDSAIELNPEHEFAYLNRGIALYYAGRYALAVQDFEQFFSKSPDDPYRMLWLYLAEREVDLASANARLKQHEKHLVKGQWPYTLIQLFSGDLDESDFTALLGKGVRNSQELANQLCEAYFYLGKYKQAEGAYAEAANYFKLALSTNVYSFVEHRYARMELSQQRVKLSGVAD